MTSPQVPLRNPYVGSGAEGARRSAQIDQEEADCLPPGEYRDHCLLSAERWNPAGGVPRGTTSQPR